ncbi:MAG: 23S rRNA (pseudouridine(1915)-N(3))-methyltransferase RlmH [Mucispirillum sp.]|nr:23S rRNA (pseudouridine(1915)-N(3))-methyltransferase RlmH [Mucispirillum sp.]
MVVRLAVEGRVKDKIILDFISEYQKRLSPYFKFEIAELGEGGRYFDKLSKQQAASEIFIAMDAGGRKFTSEGFAEWFDTKRSLSKNITFVIGEATGLSKQARMAASEVISLSDMTFSYKLSLMVMAEQIYRAVTIITGHPYHK